MCGQDESLCLKLSCNFRSARTGVALHACVVVFIIPLCSPKTKGRPTLCSCYALLSVLEDRKERGPLHFSSFCLKGFPNLAFPVLSQDKYQIWQAHLLQTHNTAVDTHLLESEWELSCLGTGGGWWKQKVFDVWQAWPPPPGAVLVTNTCCKPGFGFGVSTRVTVNEEKWL